MPVSLPARTKSRRSATPFPLTSPVRHLVRRRRTGAGPPAWCRRSSARGWCSRKSSRSQAEVPRPGVGYHGVRVPPARGRPRADAEAAVTRLGVACRACGCRSAVVAERRVVREAQAAAQPLAQEEATETGAHRRLAVARDVPGDAEAGRDRVVLLVLEGTVRPRGPAAETGLSSRGSCRARSSRPLQGSLPRAGLKSDGTKLVSLSSPV